MNRSVLAGWLAVGLLAVFYFALADRAAAESRWVSYVNPSLIADIVARDGELYLASSGGLLLYGLSDSVFEQLTNTTGLPSNFLTSLAFDSSGNLYVGTQEAGLAKIVFSPSGVSVTTLTSSFHGLTDDRVRTLAAWGDTIAYGTENGAGIVVKGLPTSRFYQRDGLPDNRVNDVLPFGEELWFATDGGVAALDRFGFIRDFSEGLPDATAKALARSDTDLWVATPAGVARFNRADSTWVSIGLADSKIFSLFFDGSALWAGGRYRFFKYEGGSWNSYSLVSVYTTHQVNRWVSEIRSLFLGPDGKLYVGFGDWLGDRRGCGLGVFDGENVWSELPNTPAAIGIPRIDFDIDGSLWIATNNFGVGKLTPEGYWVNYNKSTGGGTELSNRYQSLALLADSEGIKWFCTPEYYPNQTPIDELHDQLDADYGNDSWYHHEIGSGGGDGLGSLRLIRAAEDPAGNRWFMSDDNDADYGQWGINILSRDRTEWLQVNPTSTAQGMKGGNVYDVAFASGGAVYVAIHQYGVQLWITGGYDRFDLFDLSRDAWITIGEIGDEFASIAEINSLALRSDGTLWIGTSAGVYKYRNGSFTHIEANRGYGVGLLGQMVEDLLLDRWENLWVATDKGLNRIARDDDSDIESFTTPAVWQSELNLFFPQNVVSPLVDARCKSLALHPQEDILYVGTAGGISALNISPPEARTTALSKVFLYPNPVLGSRGDNDLKIGNISSPVLVEIFSIEGELVNRREAVESNSVVWDLTTEEGFLAASGVYLVRVSDGKGSVVKKISLIR